ncbi:MAG: hypothetical protein ABEK17_00810 [Candidatus Aenigmatarchaeota archaeon]
MRTKLNLGDNIPESKAPYKRTYKQGKSKGHQQRVRCGFCGKKVPRFKAFTTYSGFSITDPTIRKQVDDKHIHTAKKKQYVCPSCARHRGIVEKGKSPRKKGRK